MEPSITSARGTVTTRTPAPGRRARPVTDPETVRETERPLGAELATRTSTIAEIDFEPNPRSERVNRAVNFTLGVVGLIVLAPLFIVVAMAVRLSSPGPIFYLQTRVGLDRRWRRTLALRERRLQDIGGKAFTIYKFRSMRVNAEWQTGAVWATANDPRVTPVGRFLRKFRLDEIPQLINVVRGDMNLVGPRPERPSIVVRLREEIPEYMLRQRVKPGITGLAQISQHYDSCLDDVRQKVRYDVEYLRRQNLMTDVGIMLKTIPAVLVKMRGW
jgi:lipopolysaccharide/colanic/teichoic acid biosynthesis glycosyltransferase